MDVTAAFIIIFNFVVHCDIAAKNGILFLIEYGHMQWFKEE